jgi:L-lactate dehydrogenase complex protein LldG
MERKEFLRRIAERLGRTVGSPAAERIPAVAVETGIEQDRTPAELRELARRFKSELETLGGRCILAASTTEAGGALRKMLDEMQPKTIVTWDRNEFADWRIEWLWNARRAVPFSGPEEERTRLRDLIRTADVGVTTADFAVADTGTLMLSTSARKNRSVSLLPTAHIALVRESQLTQSIRGPLASLQNAERASSVHFISGPSRSSDIENDLTIGVHGPVSVTVIITRGL